MFAGCTRICLRHAFRRAVVVPAASSPSLEVQDFTFAPIAWRPAEDELLIRNSFAALPRNTQGPMPALPFYALASGEASQASGVAYVPGVSGSGAVLSAGPALPAATWLGQRVAYTTALSRSRWQPRWRACEDEEARTRFAGARGACASFLLVEAASAVPVPSSVSDEEAAAVLAHGLTAHYLVSDSYPVGPGSIVVVHAAAGGTGLLVCQMAKLRGAAMVIGICGGADKAALAQLVGRADHVIDYKATPDWPAAVRALLPADRTGADVVYAEADVLTEAQRTDLATLACAPLGSSEARSAPVILHSESPVPSTRTKTPAQTSLGDVVEALGPVVAQARLVELIEQVGEKKLAVSVSATWPLRKITTAYDALAKMNGDVAGVALLNCVD